ncbi:SulP family inorganic anion transporter [Acinetobacter sp. DSM 11652]|uniref:SulP family inorganic anion transporter n=1 Tax=Acinetobacter sp. DSM 11652 TaxID=346222 RepID=UPI0008CCF6A8|nr:sulfate permease [Acinetobacter sp. DSM 11652]SEL40386.1 sulfate permease, SulP family [Acinetobacter sp. DSM 11652]
MDLTKHSVERIIPAWKWLKKYNTQDFKSDFLASVIVLAMLVPQGMAYAMIAGLPPIMGLYASIIPMIAYALIGGSTTLSIGPVALISMMTFATLQPLYEVGSPVYIQAAYLLAVMVGIISFLLGLFRFGFLIRLISHPVIKSFIIASAVLIALGQIKFILNIPLQSSNLIEFFTSLAQYISLYDLASLSLGLASILALIYLPQLLKIPAFSNHQKLMQFVQKALPLCLVLFSILLVQSFDLTAYGIKTVGEIPSGLPPIQMPYWTWDMVKILLPGAVMIAMVSFVESISIAQATAFQSRSNLNSNQELVALGVANFGAGISGAFPVTGSLSRTVVNADAGAKTPMAGVLSSLLIIVVSLYFTSLFEYLPLGVLAATIIVSIWKLVEIKPFIAAWKYSKADGLAMALTFLGVLCIDITTGLMVGIISTFVLLLWRISRPHIAVIGLVEGTQHFRNISRHQVITSKRLVSVRIDENLSFLNANTLKEFIISEVSQHDELQHVVINCSSISNIDYSALETLEEMNSELSKLNIQLHLSEVKGPVMDRLNSTNWIQHLTGKIYLTHFQAVYELDPHFSENKSSFA